MANSLRPAASEETLSLADFAMSSHGSKVLAVSDENRWSGVETTSTLVRLESAGKIVTSTGIEPCESPSLTKIVPVRLTAALVSTATQISQTLNVPLDPYVCFPSSIHLTRIDSGGL